MSEHIDDGIVDYYAEALPEMAAAIARNLREMAEKVEREATQGPNLVGEPEWQWRASRIVHTIIWGVANLNLDSFAADAAKHDVYRAAQR